jgi:hypothetical protein
MRIRESNKPVRTVAIHRYVTDGQEAVLAYGEEVSGLVWAYAIVIPNNGQRYALRVGSSGQIERFEAPMINQVDWDCLICNALCGGLCSVGCALACVIILGVTQLAVSSFPCHHDSRSNPTPARGGQANESTQV